MKVAIGTRNPAKLAGIERAFRSTYVHVEFECLDAESGVRADPKGEEELRTGALNRARRALEKTGAELSVGAEGGTRSDDSGTYILGCVVIIDKSGRIGTGFSAQVQIPKEVEAMLNKGIPLAEAVAAVSGSEKERVRFDLGSNGILTKGLYIRKKEFDDATTCALARFKSPEFYESSNERKTEK